MEQQWENFLRFGENPKRELEELVELLSDSLIKVKFRELITPKIYYLGERDSAIECFIHDFSIKEFDVVRVSLDTEKSIFYFHEFRARNVLALHVFKMIITLKEELLA